MTSPYLYPAGIHYNREIDDYRTTRINLLFSEIPYLTGLVEGYKNGDFDFLAKIPTWVGQRSELLNFLKEDVERLSNLFSL